MNAQFKIYTCHEQMRQHLLTAILAVGVYNGMGQAKTFSLSGTVTEKASSEKKGKLFVNKFGSRMGMTL